jgi:calpain-7
LQSAATKDEALTLAISAAENLMKALKLSSDPSEKTQLKAQCADIMNVAGRIKSDTDWQPAVRPPQPTTKNERIDQWAADVVSARSVAGPEDTVSQSSQSRHGLSSTTAPVDDVSVPSGKFSASSISLGGQNERGHEPDLSGRRVQGVSGPLIGLSDDFLLSSDIKPSIPTDAGYEDRPENNLRLTNGAQVPPDARAAVSPLPPPPAQRPDRSVRQESSASHSPATAPFSQIHRLAEPISTRKRSKREEIILLKASMVNGFKCPPWDKNPSSTEFCMQPDVEVFT